jgi:hypothetical protein
MLYLAIEGGGDAYLREDGSFRYFGVVFCIGYRLIGRSYILPIGGVFFPL